MRVSGLVSSVWAAAVSVTALGSSASATYNYFDVMADPGSYDTIALGEEVTLNACNSTFHRADGSSESYTLCQLADLTDFSLQWYQWHDNVYTDLGYYSDAAAGAQLTLDTGEGTFFSEVGTYYIGLYLRVEGSSYVPLPGGGYGASGSDNSLATNGTTNFSFAWSSAFSIEPASVPGPLGALLLIPGLAYVVRRERRKLHIR